MVLKLRFYNIRLMASLALGYWILQNFILRIFHIFCVFLEKKDAISNNSSKQYWNKRILRFLLKENAKKITILYAIHFYETFKILFYTRKNVELSCFYIRTVIYKWKNTFYHWVKQVTSFWLLFFYKFYF